MSKDHPYPLNKIRVMHLRDECEVISKKTNETMRQPRLWITIAAKAISSEEIRYGVSVVASNEPRHKISRADARNRAQGRCSSHQEHIPWREYDGDSRKESIVMKLLKQYDLDQAGYLYLVDFIACIKQLRADVKTVLSAV